MDVSYSIHTRHYVPSGESLTEADEEAAGLEEADDDSKDDIDAEDLEEETDTEEDFAIEDVGLVDPTLEEDPPEGGLAIHSALIMV